MWRTMTTYVLTRYDTYFHKETKLYKHYNGRFIHRKVNSTMADVQ